MIRLLPFLRKTTKLEIEMDRPQTVSIISNAIGWLVLMAGLGIHSAWAEAPRINDNPANEPRAIVDAVLARDYLNYLRYPGASEGHEYQQLFQSYPPYEYRTNRDPDGKLLQKERAVPSFGKCAQIMLVKNIKTTRTDRAPDVTSPPGQLRSVPWEVYVTVDAEVVALVITEPDQIPEDRRCSWLGLAVKNTQTGETEHYFDNIDNDRALLAMMRQFGKVYEVEYAKPQQRTLLVLVDAHRRQWSFGYSLFLPGPNRTSKPNPSEKPGESAKPQPARWRIEAPYAPPAINYQAYLTDQKRALEQYRYLATQWCLVERVRATGKSIPPPNDPACQPDNNPLLREYFRDLAAVERGMEFLSQIR